jgi:hypothetical protein
VLVDLIPKIYTSARVIRILGYDGTPSEASIDPNAPSASQKMGLQMVYNLGVGTYDVSLDTGPSYTTMRQEQATAMMEMTQANPQMMQIAGDLIVKAMDWPGAQELADRMKLALPPEIQKAEMEKKQKNASPEMMQMMQQFEMVIQQKDQLMEQAVAKIEELMMENEKAKNESESKLMTAEAKQKEVEIKEKELVLKAAETEIKAFEAETDRIEALTKNESEQMQNSAKQQQPVESAQAAIDITPIMQSIQALQQSLQQQQSPVVVNLGAPKTKRAKAVKLPDGTWSMESREFDDEQPEGVM